MVMKQQDNINIVDFGINPQKIMPKITLSASDF